MRLVYADNNATTRVAPEVVEAMLPYLTDEYFNPSSMYDPARRPARAVAEARRTVARFFGGVRPDEIVFTSCATESNNAAIFGTLRASRDRRHVVTTAVEHPAVLNVCRELERDGYDVTFLPVDRSGRLDTVAFVKALRPGETALVSVMHANNETGVVFPVAELARIAKETDPGIVFHTDATQSVTKLPIDLTGAYRHVDLLSFSGHKIHAPKGIGTLFVRRGARWRPFLLGGHQEGGRRAGTENVPFIVGLARALELAAATREEDERRVRALRDPGLDSLRKLVKRTKKIIAPSWSPDGRWIAYVRNDISKPGIWIIDPSLENKYLVYEPPAGVAPNTVPPSWSPDSKWLTFSTDDGRIWIIDITGNQLKEILGPGPNIAPGWSK